VISDETISFVIVLLAVVGTGAIWSKT